MCSLSAAIRVKAALSRTTTESALLTKRFIARSELYGCTTTSDDSGKTEYVWMSFLGNRSFKRSRRKEPSPDPVPPAIECSSMNPLHGQLSTPALEQA